jgi:hypothetical protein
MDSNNQVFDDAYWLHQPKPVRALRRGQAGQVQLSEAEQLELAHSLMGQGFVIDGPIMLWGWGPYNVMLLRRLYGFASVPALNEDPTGAKTGGGSIRVSIDINDYPPIEPPSPPPDHAPLSTYVGSSWGAGIYGSLKGDPTADGQEATGPDGAIYVKHRVLSFGGKIASWYTRKIPLIPPDDPALPGPPPGPGDFGGM